MTPGVLYLAGLGDIVVDVLLDLGSLPWVRILEGLDGQEQVLVQDTHAR